MFLQAVYHTVDYEDHDHESASIEPETNDLESYIGMYIILHIFFNNNGNQAHFLQEEPEIIDFYFI